MAEDAIPSIGAAAAAVAAVAGTGPDMSSGTAVCTLRRIQPADQGMFVDRLKNRHTMSDLDGTVEVTGFATFFLCEFRNNPEIQTHCSNDIAF